MRGRRIAWAVVVLGVVLGASVGTVRVEADSGATTIDPLPDAELSIDETLSVLYRDGDHVVFGASTPADHGDVGDEPVDAKGSGTGNGPVVHDGFTTYGDAMALRGYEIVLVSSSGIEQMRPYLADAASVAMAGGAPPLRVAPGTIPPGSRPGKGEIHVTVSSSSPCTGAWLGCAGPIIDDGVVTAGQIWINPRLITRNASKIGNTTRHELGHTLGLGHYDAPFEGRTQTMHSSSFDASTYEAGDRAGFRFVTGNDGPDPGPPPAPAAAHARTPPPQPRSGDPAGAVEQAEAGPFGVVIRGWAIDPDSTVPVSVLVTIDGAPVEALADRERSDGSTNGFEVEYPAATGAHEVCVLLRNTGSGIDTPLGCRILAVSEQSIGRVGLQTV